MVGLLLYWHSSAHGGGLAFLGRIQRRTTARDGRAIDGRQLRHQSALLEKLSYENALLKRKKFSRLRRKFHEGTMTEKVTVHFVTINRHPKFRAPHVGTPSSV